MKKLKKWGESFTITNTLKAEISYIKVLPGGFSSMHYHKLRHNIFFVVKGELDIFTTGPDNIIHLTPDGLTTCDIPPGKHHRFYSDKGAEAYEIYLIKDVYEKDDQLKFDMLINDPLDALDRGITEEDIVRLNEGGIVQK